MSTTTEQSFTERFIVVTVRYPDGPSNVLDPPYTGDPIDVDEQAELLSADLATWARENGHEVSERGRIPNSVVQAYEAAH